MSRTEDFFSRKPVAFSAPTTRPAEPSCSPAEASTSKAHLSRPSLEERLLKAVQELAQEGAEEPLGSSSDEWESASSQEGSVEEEEEQEAWTPQDSPLAASPTHFPKHHSFEFPLKPALKTSAAMSRTASSGSTVSFNSEETHWVTYSPRSYSRRGPAPVKRLTVEQILEMQNLGCLPWHFVGLPLDDSPVDSPPHGISKFDSSSSEEEDAA